MLEVLAAISIFLLLAIVIFMVVLPILLLLRCIKVGNLPKYTVRGTFFGFISMVFIFVIVVSIVGSIEMEKQSASNLDSNSYEIEEPSKIEVEIKQNETTSLKSHAQAPVQNKPEEQPKRQPQEKPKQQPVQNTITNITWKEIDKIYSIDSGYTDLQKKELWKSYKGLYVQWTGEVSHLDDMFGKLTLQVKLNYDTLVSDVLINLNSEERNKVMNLRVGDKVTFTGKLESYTGIIMPVTLSDGKIIF